MKRIIGRVTTGALALCGLATVGYLVYRGVLSVLDDADELASLYDDEFEDDFEEEITEEAAGAEPHEEA